MLFFLRPFCVYMVLLFHHLFLLHCVYDYCAFNFKSTIPQCETVSGWQSHLIHSNTIFLRRVNFTKTIQLLQGVDRPLPTIACETAIFSLSHFYLDSFYTLRMSIVCVWRHPLLEPYTIHYISYIHFNWIACHASLWELYDIRLKMPRHNMIMLTLSIPHAHAQAHRYMLRLTITTTTTTANAVNTSKTSKQTNISDVPTTHIHIELLSRLIFRSLQVVLLLRRSVLPHTHSSTHIYFSARAFTFSHGILFTRY